MQLSVSSGSDGILQRATFLTFGDSSSHIITYPLADMVASANRWVHKVATWIWAASGTWEFDDSNQSTLPVAYATMVDGQEDYSLPATTLQIKEVEILSSDGVSWSKLRQVDKSEITEAWSEFERTKGFPYCYDIDGFSLILKPAPDETMVTVANGLRIYLAREIVEFSTPATYTTADTTQPGFDELFHDIICQGIAHDYLDAHGDPRADRIFQKIEVAHNDLNIHYGMKNKDNKIRISPRQERYD